MSMKIKISMGYYFDVIKNEIELCLGTDEIKQQLIAVIKKIALK